MNYDPMTPTFEVCHEILQLLSSAIRHEQTIYLWKVYLIINRIDYCFWIHRGDSECYSLMKEALSLSCYTIISLSLKETENVSTEHFNVPERKVYLSGLS